jgi:hypothetical protein
MDNLSTEDMSCKELRRMDFIDDLIMIQTYMNSMLCNDEELEFGIVFRETKLDEG